MSVSSWLKLFLVEGEEKNLYYEEKQFQRFARAFSLIICLFHRRSFTINNLQWTAHVLKLYGKRDLTTLWYVIFLISKPLIPTLFQHNKNAFCTHTINFECKRNVFQMMFPLPSLLSFLKAPFFMISALSGLRQSIVHNPCPQQFFVLNGSERGNLPINELSLTILRLERKVFPFYSNVERYQLTAWCLDFYHVTLRPDGLALVLLYCFTAQKKKKKMPHFFTKIDSIAFYRYSIC